VTWKAGVPEAISNTSPLLYLYRIEALHWLPKIFDQVWTAEAVSAELRAGAERGHDVPRLNDYGWLKLENPQAIPSQWLALDLGSGELAVLALALENPGKVVLLDDGLARRIAQTAGLPVWGTLRVILEAKKLGLTESVAPLVDRLAKSGMWISPSVRNRVLVLAGEA
jgi:predicted nucleic acid-binding protein